MTNHTPIPAPVPTIAVLGGTGKTGRRVVDRLRHHDVTVRVGSRAANPPFDWTEPDTWPAILDGADSAYLAYSPDVAAPGAAEVIEKLATMAVDAGVGHLVLLSGRGEEEAWASEDAVKNSGTAWTIIRASWLYQNFSEAFLLDPVRYGEVVLPAGDVAEPFADAEDVADVAVAALTEPGHTGQTYELTGPRLLSFPIVIDEIAAAAGRDIRYRQVSTEQFAADLAAQAVPADYVEFLSGLFTKVLDGRNAHVTDDVRRVLGRDARDFTDYARSAAATGVWSR